MTAAPAWRTSLHGGHSGTYCDHATGSLRQILEAAIAGRMSVYGISEHVPRLRADLLYPEERALGWDVAHLESLFAEYTRELSLLAGELADRVVVLRGFESEVVPAGRYADQVAMYRASGSFDYFVGSVHHVGEVLIDGPPVAFQTALDAAGGLEALSVAYYGAVEEMVRRLRPDVVGHFDLIRKNGHRFGDVDTPRARAAAGSALDAVRAAGSILDLNVAGPRKGLAHPYPAPWIVAEAHRRGIPFCFGDDAHGPETVGLGLDEGRTYLEACGVGAITRLNRVDGAIVREVVPLQP